MSQATITVTWHKSPYPVELNLDADTVADLRTKLYDATGVLPAVQKFAGKPRIGKNDDNKLLAELGFTDGARIKMLGSRELLREPSDVPDVVNDLDTLAEQRKAEAAAAAAEQLRLEELRQQQEQRRVEQEMRRAQMQQQQQQQRNRMSASSSSAGASSISGVPSQEQLLTVLADVEYGEQFLAWFQSLFGDNHPSMLLCGRHQAVRQAKDEAKMLMFYVHGTDDQDSTVFATSVLQNQAVIDTMDQNFLLWAGSMSSEAAARHRINLPYAITVMFSGSIMSVVDVMYSLRTVDEMLGTLFSLVETYAPMLEREALMQVADGTAVQVRTEQDREYEESLAADRAKRLEREEEERAQAEVEAKLLSAEESFLAERTRRIELAAQRTAPGEGEDGAMDLTFAMPSGERVSERFASSERVADVVAVVELHLSSQADEEQAVFGQEVHLIARFPTRTLSIESNGDRTLADMDLQDGDMLSVKITDISVDLEG